MSLYLTTHNTRKRHSCPGSIRNRNPVKAAQIYDLDRATAWIGMFQADKGDN